MFYLKLNLFYSYSSSPSKSQGQFATCPYIFLKPKNLFQVTSSPSLQVTKSPHHQISPSPSLHITLSSQLRWYHQHKPTFLNLINSASNIFYMLKSMFFHNRGCHHTSIATSTMYEVFLLFV